MESRELHAVRAPEVRVVVIGTERRDLHVTDAGSSVATATVPNAFS